ncbi:DUF2442 domain-containing protein [Allorhizobium pseudoryzae]|uniref:DUF2442 domain-containing protein n=1 Tax=Allorhizobium pseudoryzae TaxID=379684 RepID=UPI003CFF9702
MADISDAALAQARERWQEERANRPIPASVRYETASGHIVIDFTNGSIFMVPARALEGLEDASDAALSEVELLGETGLHWESLDVDFRIAGLMNGIFGTSAFMETRSEATGLRLQKTPVPQYSVNDGGPKRSAK